MNFTASPIDIKLVLVTLAQIVQVPTIPNFSIIEYDIIPLEGVSIIATHSPIVASGFLYIHLAVDPVKYLPVSNFIVRSVCTS